MLALSSGCGFILYPERRGRTSGRIDIPVLIIDLLWLIPGLIPGVICLVVDFTTGCIYQSGGHASAQPPPSSDDRRVATATVEIEGTIVATGEISSGGPTRLDWKRAVDAEELRAKARLLIRTPSGTLARAEIGELI